MLPIDLVLVRHGESEGNVARRFSESGDDSLFTEQFMDRHSSMLRLTDRGRTQALAAGPWIRENIAEYFDSYRVSTFVRAMETAALLNLPDAKWRLDDYLRERDMADWDNVSEGYKKAQYAKAYAAYLKDPFRWQPPGGGESVAQLCFRADRVLDTLHRECSDQKVIMTCHGMLMWAFIIRIERLTPQMFVERRDSKLPFHRIRNCQVIHYTRRDPVTKRLSSRANWVRSVSPADLEHSDLAWHQIERPMFTNQDLLGMVNQSPRYVS